MPYTIDLARLATSAHLAIDAGRLKIGQKEACDAILAGYKGGLEAGGRPWVIGREARVAQGISGLSRSDRFLGKAQRLARSSRIACRKRRGEGLRG